MKPLAFLQKTDALLMLFGLAFVVFGWFTFALALSSLFLFPLLAIGGIFFFLLALFFAGKLLVRSPWDTRAVFIVALAYAAIVSGLAEPTVFSGRDQGSISEAAYRLAENGQLAFSTPASQGFFQIYGPGTALNFPGFAYTGQGDLITQFPLAYTAWLGAFVSFFHLSGFAAANGILLFLFLFFLYALFRQFVKPWHAASGLLIAAFSFLPVWISKVTLTENLGAFLFVFLSLALLFFVREGKFLSYAAALAAGSLFAFTRIEGFAFLGITGIILLSQKRTYSLWKRYPWKSLILPALLFVFVLLRDYFLSLPYYKMIGKALFKFCSELGLGNAAAGASVSGLHSLSLGEVFFAYGLLPVFLLGLVGIVICIKERRWEALIPLFLALPTFIYLFSPNITPDYPWMLRRYYFSVFPALLYFAVLALGFFADPAKRFPLAAPRGRRLLLSATLALGILAWELPAWLSGAAFAENRGLREQVAAFASGFSERDLVLVDPFTTGNGFAMLSGPGNFLFRKNTVYFFNPEDLSRLDIAPFEGIYLLVPEQDLERYAQVFGDHLVFRQSLTFSSEQYESLSLTLPSPWRLPAKTEVRSRVLLFQVY